METPISRKRTLMETLKCLSYSFSHLGNDKYLTESQMDYLHPMNEMANISVPEDRLRKSTVVCVYPEKDLQGTKTPHIHVEIDNKKIILEVYIEDLRSLRIWRTKYGRKISEGWSGVVDVKKQIDRWLTLPNYDDPTHTNLEEIVITWNRMNTTNRVTLDFALGKHMRDKDDHLLPEYRD